MSATDVSTQAPPPGAHPSPTHAAPRRGVSARTWAAVVLACAAMLASAGVRAWQARRVERGLMAARRRPPVDLSELPLTLGPWRGSPIEVDEAIARGTGADQIVTRRYVNQDTGVALEVIVLYGPAVEMYIHAPELCYPSAGFTRVDGPELRPVVVRDGDGPGALTVPFRTLVYSKGEGARADVQEVYYTWWYNGRWTPDVGKQKHFERIPGMYKVHLARRVTPGEKRDADNPCEAFLQDLLPVIGRRMSAAAPGPNAS